VDGILGLLLAAACPDLDIRALTVTVNTTAYEKDIAAAFWLKSFLPPHVPLGVGAGKPVIPLPRAAEFARGVRFPAAPPSAPAPFAAAAPVHAWDVFIQEASKAPGKVELITLGPLTNVAIGLLRYPELAKNIKRIIIAGGSAHTGNASAYSEYTIAADPYAADAVFKSGVPITMIGIDGLPKTVFTREELLAFASRLSAAKGTIPGFFRRVLEWSLEDGFKGPDLHNLIAVASVINPGIARLSSHYVEIETRSSISAGQTVTDLFHRTGREPQTDILVDLDKEGLLFVLEDTLNRQTA
jgi:pyrimidine-specific ribonucleoside hydrolase